MAGETERARRGVPVLAEISVVFASVSRMRRLEFLLVPAISNLAVSMIYVALGVSAASVIS